ncbi:sugar transferase [Lacipirellula parvula]|uniref:Undecaprenyl-phosphate galactosephosphotransferase n=1 Tax=Lacipirellula parvula TaxID=2650471 RepID=A0A5K7X8N0_9BACT|nr:sugar transferase [Lacipirellula parvula]BBO33000.1 undecaprenyl-phosphate galactosephosphotransferase [Lacipirellula parvula]
MPQDTAVRRLHARVLARRSAPAPSFLLNDEEFRFAADCERMRVDRNGSVLSLLLIRLPRGHAATTDVTFMARLLEGRLRLTDTPGELSDGRIAVLLPDTPSEGAWKVATDLSEVYPPGPARPECDVLVYPPHRKLRDDDSELEEEASEAPTELASEGEAAEPTDSEFFFAKSTPPWKRAIDVLGAIVGLTLASPVILTAAAAIKATSPGPAFFVQKREGLGGRTFPMWKLRTMHQGADDLKEQLLELSQQDGPAFKMRKDPRTTRLGRLLRWTSIDELPQFWNVLRGEMSLVGPRPLPVAESQACDTWHRRRLSVNPGMTCTWQVSGRGAVSFDEWVRMDLQYARKRSAWQDVKLIVMTVPALLFHRGMR